MAVHKGVGLAGLVWFSAVLLIGCGGEDTVAESTTTSTSRARSEVSAGRASADVRAARAAAVETQSDTLERGGLRPAPAVLEAAARQEAAESDAAATGDSDTGDGDGQAETVEAFDPRAVYYGESRSSALDEINARLETDPTAPALRHWKGRLLYDRGEYQRAADLFEDAAEDGATEQAQAESFYRLGLTKRKLGAFDSAMEAVDQALALREDHDDAYRVRLELLTRSEDPSTAQAALDELIELAGEDVTNLRRIGDTLRRSGRDGEAIDLYQRALEVEPGDRDARIGHIESLQALGRTEEALALATALVDDFSSDPIARKTRGDVLLDVGEEEDAIDEFENAAELDPRNPEYLIRQSRVLRSLGRHERSLRLAERAVAVEPNSARTLAALGWAQKDAGRWESALASFDAAIDRAPDDRGLRRARADMLRRLGRSEAALREIDSLLEVQPNKAENHVRRGLILVDLGRWADAADAFDRALVLDPIDETAERGLAEARAHR